MIYLTDIAIDGVQEVAEVLGISRQMVNKYKTGAVTTPRKEVADRIDELFEANWDSGQRPTYLIIP